MKAVTYLGISNAEIAPAFQTTYALVASVWSSEVISVNR